MSFVASVQCNCAIFYRFWKQHLKGWSAIRSQRVRAKLAHLKHKQTKREIWRNAIDGCCWRECVSHILTIVCADGGCWCNNGIVCCPLYWGEGVLSRYPVVPFSGLSSSFQVGVIIRRLRLPGRSGGTDAGLARALRHWRPRGKRALFFFFCETHVFQNVANNSTGCFDNIFGQVGRLCSDGREGAGWVGLHTEVDRSSFLSKTFLTSLSSATLSTFPASFPAPPPLCREIFEEWAWTLDKERAGVASWDWTQSTWTRPARDAEGGGGQPGSVGNGTLIENDGGEVDVSLFTAYRPSSKPKHRLFHFIYKVRFWTRHWPLTISITTVCLKRSYGLGEKEGRCFCSCRKSPLGNKYIVYSCILKLLFVISFLRNCLTH